MCHATMKEEIIRRIQRRPKCRRGRGKDYCQILRAGGNNFGKVECSIQLSETCLMPMEVSDEVLRQNGCGDEGPRDLM